MAVSVAPRRSPRLISSRSASLSRPGPGDQLKGFTIRVGGFMITFQAVCSEESICSPISVKLSPLRSQPKRHRSLFSRQMWSSHFAISSVISKLHGLTEKLRGPLETAG